MHFEYAPAPRTRAAFTELSWSILYKVFSLSCRAFNCENGEVNRILNFQFKVTLKGGSKLSPSMKMLFASRVHVL